MRPPDIVSLLVEYGSHGKKEDMEKRRGGSQKKRGGCSIRPPKPRRLSLMFLVRLNGLLVYLSG